MDVGQPTGDDDEVALPHDPGNQVAEHEPGLDVDPLGVVDEDRLQRGPLIVGEFCHDLAGDVERCPGAVEDPERGESRAQEAFDEAEGRVLLELVGRGEGDR